MTLLIRNARVLTLAGPRPRRGKALTDLAVVPAADVLIGDQSITAILTDGAVPRTLDTHAEIDARGRILMPAFVDCHTHACWAGDRLDEWDLRRHGVPYLDILKGGGGIMSTVRATRAATQEHLAALLRHRLAAMLRCGTATVEVKSGYGLSAEHELTMLRAIRSAKDPGSDIPHPTLIPTAMLAHAHDPEQPSFVERTISETLPAISREFPGITIDAYCEAGAWSLGDTLALFARAREFGHPVRVHADQFNSLGMIPQAVRIGARSVDHLEASTPEDLDLLAASETFGVIIPICGFHLDGGYANARRLVDSGGLLALATNYNPGSAPSPSMPMAIALAVRHCGLSPAEAIVAATLNPAELLGLHDRGQIAPGQRADLILLRHTDERMLAYEFGDNPVDALIIGGRTVFSG
jgi:imidazolonepropionase